MTYSFTNKYQHYIKIAHRSFSYRLVLLLLREAMRRVYSTEANVVFTYELKEQLLQETTASPLTVTPAGDHDIEEIIPDFKDIRDLTELKRCLEILAFQKERIPTPFIGKMGGIPVALCWLIFAEQNKALLEYFNGGIRELGSRDALLEFIYIKPTQRGSALMKEMTIELFRIAKRSGKNRAISLINTTNTKSLNGAKKIGWQPELAKQVNLRLFRRNIAFSPYSPQRLSTILFQPGTEEINQRSCVSTITTSVNASNLSRRLLNPSPPLP